MKAIRAAKWTPIGSMKWLNPKEKGWANFINAERKTIDDIRSEIQNLASETGLDIAEYRRIVRHVQKGEREARIAKKEMVEANLRLVISYCQKIHQPWFTIFGSHPRR